MKNKFKVIAILTLITFGAVVILNFTVYQTKKEKQDNQKSEMAENKNVSYSDDAEEKSCCEMEETDTFSDKSIYQLDADWKNQFNKNFELSELRGKKVILTMFFASCPYACPILVNDMKRIKSFFENESLDNYRFVLVSIDPDNDSPEVLKQYSENHNLDLDRWILLTGSKDEIAELAALIGFRFKKNEDGNFSHSNLITFLNKEGEIIHQQIGLNQDISEASEIMTKLN